MTTRLLLLLLLGLVWVLPGTSSASDVEGAPDGEGEGEEDEDDDEDAATEDEPAAQPLRVTVEESRTRSPLDAVGTTTVLTRRDLEVSAGAFDEPLRALQALPGITGDTASRASFFVRAAPATELRFELDGIPLRRLTHTGDVSSVFQRDLLHTLRLESAGMPVAHPQALAGGLLASYIDGPQDGFDGSVELSMLSASGHIAVDLGRSKQSLVLGARQSLLPLYLAAANAAGAFENTPPEVSSTEGFLRWTLRPTEHKRLRATFLLHRDRLLFDDVDGRHHSIGAGVDWQEDTPEGGQRLVQLTHASHHEERPTPLGREELAGRPGLDDEHRTHLRLAIHQPLLTDFSAAGGFEAAAVTRRLEGRFDDWRSVPNWVWRPLAAPAAGKIDLSALDTWAEISLWGRVEHKSERLEIKAGGRVDLLNRSRVPMASGRFRFRVRVSPTTHLSIGSSIGSQERMDALLFDPSVPPRSLLPERAAHLDIGIDQALGTGGHVSLLGWHRRSESLVVWDDHPQAPGAPSNEGFGQAWGLQSRLAFVRDRLRFEASYALGSARRTNPRALQLGTETASLGDPRHSARIAADLSIGKRRNMVLSGDYAWSSGWAVATLAAVQGSGATWTWDPTSFDSDRTEGSHRLAVRWEHTFPFERWRLRGTVALAGVPFGSGPVRDCPPTPEEGQDEPTCATLDFLPAVMPWVGLRAEW